MRLEGKIAYITGAGSGIGRASAQAMAREGALVAVADLDLESAEGTAELIRGALGTAIALAVDVSVESEVADSIAQTVAQFGRLDIMHLNAGIGARDDKNVVDTPDSAWDLAYRVNLLGVVHGARHGIPAMIATGGGNIVITSSLAGESGDFNRVAYASSKGAVTTLTRYIATAFGRSGINANAILPGLVLSPNVAEQFPEPLREAVSQHQVVDRFTEPEDVANLAVFLASDEAVAVRGQAIRIDAGVSAMGSASPTVAQAMQGLGF